MKLYGENDNFLFIQHDNKDILEIASHAYGHGRPLGGGGEKWAFSALKIIFVKKFFQPTV